MYSPAIEHAIHVAFEAHAGQTRKSSGMAYMTHPVHVALILARAGADEVTIQAGVLHDVVEDCDGWTLARLRSEFGDEVADTVTPLTEESGQPWEARKAAALAHVPHMSARSAAVKSADKIHNMQSLVRGLAEADDPQAVWSDFSRSPEVTIDLAVNLVDALTARLGELDVFPTLAAQLRTALQALQVHRP